MGQESLKLMLANLEITNGFRIGHPDKGLGIILAVGATVPSAVAGYAVSGLFLHSDGGDNTMLYINEGTLASCTFAAVTAA